jgi:hypothetical protein
MQYMLMFYESQEGWASRTDERAPGYWGGWAAYVKAVDASGIRVSGAGLQPPGTSTSLRIRANRKQVQDGPFADTKEQLGGFFVIDVPDLDAALEWAAKAPCAASGGVEVRPVLPPMPQS